MQKAKGRPGCERIGKGMDGGEVGNTDEECLMDRLGELVQKEGMECAK